VNEQPDILDAAAQARIADYIDSRPIQNIIAITATYFNFRRRDILSNEQYRRVARTVSPCASRGLGCNTTSRAPAVSADTKKPGGRKATGERLVTFRVGI
jgi:hypothetical protein